MSNNDQVALLLAYHHYFPNLSPQTFLFSLNLLNKKWCEVYGFQKPVDLDWENLPVTSLKPKYLVDEDVLHRMLYECDFRPDLEVLFTLDIKTGNNLFRAISLEALILKHCYKRPDLFYQRIGGDSRLFLSRIELSAEFSFFRLSGELNGIKFHNPGHCLKKFFILYQYLEPSSKGRIGISTVKDPSRPHIQFEEWFAVSGGIRFQWGNYKNKVSGNDGCYPLNYLDESDEQNLNQWAFYYQNYQHHMATDKEIKESMFLTLTAKGLPFERVGDKILKGSCTNKQWKIVQHMLGAYMQSKYRHWPKLHRYSELVKFEPEYFTMADNFLYKLHEDLVVLTTMPYLEKTTTTIEKKVVEVEEKSRKVFKELATKNPMPILNAVKKDIEEEKKIVIPENPPRYLSWLLSLTDDHYRKALKVIGHPKTEWSSILSQDFRRNEEAYISGAVNAINLAKENGLSDEDIHRLKRPRGFHVENAIFEQRGSMSAKNLRQAVRKANEEYDSLIRDHPEAVWNEEGLWASEIETFTIPVEKTVLETQTKYTTKELVSVGSSIYRKVDFANVVEKNNRNLLRATPSVRAGMEAIGRLKKAKKKRDANKLTLEGKELYSMSFKEMVNAVGYYKAIDADKKRKMMYKKFGKDAAKIKKTNERRKKCVREVSFIELPERLPLAAFVVDGLRKRRKDRQKSGPSFIRKFFGFGAFDKSKAEGVKGDKVREFLKGVACPKPAADFEVPAFLFSEFQDLKARVVFRKVFWTVPDEENKRRSRKHYRGVGNIAYNQLFLK